MAPRWFNGLHTSLLCLIVVSSAQAAVAFAQPSPSVVPLTLRGDSRGCLAHGALSARIKHYLTNPAQTPARLSVRVRAPNAGTTEFALERDGTTLAVRRFAALPKACLDRLDAIALAIALAVEQARSSAVDPQPVAEAALAPTGAQSARESAANAAVASVDAPRTQVANEAVQPAPRSEPNLLEHERRAKAATARQPAARAPIAPVSTAPPTVTREPVDRAHEESSEVSPGSNSGISALRLSLQVGGNVVFEVLPAPVVAGSLGAELGIGEHASVRLSGLLTAQTRSPLAGADALASLIGGQGSMCWRAHFEWFALNPCLGAIAGRVAARGDGYLRNDAADVFWLATLAHVGVRLFERGPVGVELGVDGYVNLVRPDLRVDAASEGRAVTPPLALSSGLDLIFAL
jgi:hypothetical protein